jgi:hypothetical protein
MSEKELADMISEVEGRTSLVSPNERRVTITVRRKSPVVSDFIRIKGIGHAFVVCEDKVEDGYYIICQVQLKDLKRALARMSA